MYSNAGKSIKSYVSVVVTIGFVISIIQGIAISGVGAESESAIIVILGLVLAGLGCLSAWLSGLLLYAYGEIADRLISIDDKMPCSKSAAEGKSQDAAPVTKGFYCDKCGAKNAPGTRYCVACSAELPKGKVNSTIPDGGWRCTCGRVNANYVSTCPCGIHRREIQK